MHLQARTFACLALVAAALAGCASSQLLPFNGTITDAIRANPQMTILSSLLDMTGLGYALTASGPYTFYGGWPIRCGGVCTAVPSAQSPPNHFCVGGVGDCRRRWTPSSLGGVGRPSPCSPSMSAYKY